MGRAPCCDKANVKRGPWSPEEDTALKNYVERHGSGGNWIALPQKAGLNRCGKSCRLRWLNYLRPDIKHGGFTEEEDNMICALYSNIGSRWSVIASQLPGRTDNDVKNYWNTKLKKKLLAGKISQALSNNNNITTTNNNIHLSSSTSPASINVGLGQNVDSRHNAPNPNNYPLPGLMEASEFGANADNSQGLSSSQEASGHSASSAFVLDSNYVSWWSGNGGVEDDGLLMDFGFGSSYDLLNGFSLQEKTNEAAPSLANSSYTNLFTNVSDTNY